MHFDIYDLIDKLSTRTAMYTGKHTLSHIRTYIDGYSHAMHEIGGSDISNPSFDNFPKWVAEKYGFRRYTVSYPEIILAVILGISPDNVQWTSYDEGVTDAQHHQSVSLFFDLLAEYKSAK